MPKKVAVAPAAPPLPEVKPKKKATKETPSTALAVIPPSHAEKLVAQAKGLAKAIHALKVIGEDSLGEAASYLNTLGEVEKGIQRVMKPVKAATDNAHKEAVRLEKGFLDPVLTLKAEVKVKVDGYLEDQREIERAALQKKQEAEEAYQRKLEKAVHPERVKPPEEVFIPPTPSVAGIATIERWFWEVFDYSAFWAWTGVNQHRDPLLVDLLSINESFMREWVNSKKEAAIGAIPGVRVWSELRSQRS